jgi:hypothetical protein
LFAVGVGNDKDPISLVRGAKGSRRYAIPFEIIPARGQVTGDGSKSANKDRWDVFHDDNTGSKLANDSRKFAP